MEKSCEHCEENNAERFCRDCELAYCLTCSEFIHRKVRANLEMIIEWKS